MKIANKITLSFLITGIILTVAASSVFYFIARNNLQQAIEDKLTLLGHSRADSIEIYLDMLEVSVVQLSKSVIFEAFLESLDKKDSNPAVSFSNTMDRLKSTKNVNPSIYEFLLLDKQGIVVASSNEANIGLDKSTDAYFLGGKLGVYIKDAYILESVGEPLITLSAPCLSSKGNQLLGVIAARVKLNDLYNIVAHEIGLGKTGEVYIVNKYGFMISPSRFRDDTFLKQKTGSENTRQARLLKHDYHEAGLLDAKTVRVFLDYRGVLVLGDYDYIPRMQWSVLTEIDVQEAFAPLTAIHTFFLFILILVSISIFVLSIIIARAITSPLNKLNEGVRIIGSGNLDYRINSLDKDEIGKLSQAFDKMVQDLKKSTVSIDSLTCEIDNRKKIEGLLRESKEYLFTTLNSVGDALIAVDVDAKITFINPVAEGLTGWQKSEAVGRHIDEVFVIKKEKTGENAENPVLRVLSNGKVSNLENHTILISKDAITYVIDDSAAPIIDSGSQKVVGVVLVFRDITEHNKIEKVLRQLSIAVEQSPACVVITDIKGNITYVNHKFVELTKYSMEEVIGQNPRVLKSGEQSDSYYKELWDTITAGKEWRGEFHNKKKNNELYWERALISPMYDKDGVISSFIGIKEDITDYKLAQEKLRETAHKYKTLVENVPGIVYRCANDAKWTMFFISDEISRLTGYPASDFINNAVRDFASVIHPDDKDRVNNMIQQALLEKKPYTIEYRIVCADTHIIWVQERGKGVFDPKGNVLWLDGVVTDITLLKQAEEQMKLTMEMQIEFTSTVSHELRTPLTAIKEGIAIVLDGSAGDINDEQKDFLDTAKRNVDRLTRLINDVLDFQKLKAGKTRFNIEPADINETIEDVYKQMFPEAKKKVLEFTLSLDRAIPKINFDRDAIIRVLINLVNNAFKFTDKGLVTVSSYQRPDENSVYVRVEDTGSGIKESDVSKLFEDYEQLEKGKDRKTGGTGLGLAISKKIIAQHGGRIWAESEVGKGTAMIFVLPIMEKRISHD